MHGLRRRSKKAARDSALDALIQVHAEVPAELSVVSLRARPAQALILLTRVPSGGETELFELLVRETRDEWYAAANILVARRTKRVAGVLMNRLLLTTILPERACIS